MVNIVIRIDSSGILREWVWERFLLQNNGLLIAGNDWTVIVPWEEGGQSDEKTICSFIYTGSSQ